MSMAFILIKRNIRLFFKDKGMFFTSLITPAILLILYVTFLGNVYRDSLTSNLPNSLRLSESIIEGLVGGQLISSILAVSCVTVAFCSNFLMVQTGYNLSSRNLIWDIGRVGLVVSHNSVNDGNHLPAGMAYGRHVGLPFIPFFLEIKLQRRIVKYC